MNNPLVSICCIAYNHAPFIRQCIDGFLMQKTSFKYEIIIHDDCSTDGTTDIIREYADKYPDIIRPIYQQENQYSKGVRGMFGKFVFPVARGKYLAICEGDDFWTSSNKLQMQVDVLEAHHEYAFCCHRFRIYDERVKMYRKEYAYDYYTDDTDIIIDSELFFKTWITQYCTTVIRKSQYLEAHKQAANLDVEERDVIVFYYLLKNADGISLNHCMATYRWHSGGVAGIIPLKQKRLSAYRIYNVLYQNNPTDELLKNKLFVSIQKCLQHGNLTYKQKNQLLKQGVDISHGSKQKLMLIVSYMIPDFVFDYLYKKAENFRDRRNYLMECC